MPTVREEKLADIIIENAVSDKGMTAKQMLVKAGYDETTAQATPGRVIAQDGVQEALAAKGFSEENAKRVIGEIIDDKRTKPDTRINAAKEIFKVSGSYAPEKKLNVNLSADIEDFKQYEELSLKYDEDMKRKMLE